MTDRADCPDTSRRTMAPPDADDRFPVPLHGVAVDSATRCDHYDSDLDVVAIRFAFATITTRVSAVTKRSPTTTPSGSHRTGSTGPRSSAVAAARRCRWMRTSNATTTVLGVRGGVQPRLSTSPGPLLRRRRIKLSSSDQWSASAKLLPKTSDALTRSPRWFNHQLRPRRPRRRPRDELAESVDRTVGIDLVQLGGRAEAGRRHRQGPGVWSGRGGR